MKQDTRVLIAFALSFVMLVLWRVFFVKEAPKPATPPADQPAATAPAKPGPATTTSSASPSGGATSNAAKSSKPAEPVALPVEQGTAAQDITIESDLYRVTIST